MSKRYYLSDILGDGSIDSPFRPAVADLGVNHVAVIPSDPTTGRPTSTWCLVLVATINHARVAAARGVDPLPDVTLDTQVNSIDKAKSDAAKAALQRRGAVGPTVSPGDGYGKYLRGIGRQLEPAFDETNFDVSD